MVCFIMKQFSVLCTGIKHGSDVYIIYYIFMEGHILTVSCCILFLLKSYIMNESDL